MEGVILYADDHIYTPNRAESVLFDTLRERLPVLGVHNLELASSAIKSIGSFKALILDWQYGDIDGNDDLFAEAAAEVGEKKLIKTTSQKEDAAFKFLSENDFYSLIYIFSEIDIEENYGERLREKFGDRIQIRKKNQFTTKSAPDFASKIIEEVEEWKEKNESLSIPIIWSSAINESMQKIFKELSEADKTWIKDIYDSATSDGVDAELFVIELLQLLLSESLVQNRTLIEPIKKLGDQNKPDIADKDKVAYQKSLSKLFSRLYYSALSNDAPVMTGDICQLNENTFGIIVTPECDIKKVKNTKTLYYDVLVFKIDSLKEVLTKDHVKKNKKSIFFQVIPSLHFLPSIPFLSEDFKVGSVIDFSQDSIKTLSSEMDENLKKYPRKYKINSPFIQQLRQRYISHIGRVGTPALPSFVRDWNLQ